VRLIAGHDPLRYAAMLDVPLREALLAYEARLREAALEDYRAELLQWAVLAPHSSKRTKPPPRPSILED
jgi:hypothetical protein